ncbi:TetR/AcrR family transcriptional regulator [Tenggerimyces flavus]|uniref:TetR/AcrR family transcriptional regulator n=1 Tax=Tenggerimyces flavus TaxID=1708749 RepID=A0ABV7YEC0_9ACTN|nr:TetR/AcrR family transcriptional regulator [Tenggerimyces flavus]MBM7784246.1 AcrR family transcriptional regulator [Tenggerimyces flavus]
MSPRRAAAVAEGRSLREHLVATAERLLATRGTAGLSVRTIAREAGVADGVLYNHFADKEELLAAALDAHVRTTQARLGTLPEPGSRTVEFNLRTHLAYGLTLHRAILPAFTGLVGQPAVLARFAELHDQKAWRASLRDYLAAERERGRLAPEAPIEAAVAMLVGLCHDTVLSGLLEARPPRTPPLEDVVAVVLRGLGPVA